MSLVEEAGSNRKVIDGLASLFVRQDCLRGVSVDSAAIVGSFSLLSRPSETADGAIEIDTRAASGAVGVVDCAARSERYLG